MRITGGRVKGRVLAAPKGLDIRPTTDRVREAIFSIIGQDLSGLNVLDLFAGTGSLGLEALSRGAGHALFIDHSQESIHLIRKNLARCGFQHAGAVLKKNLAKGIPRGHPLLAAHNFDLVFLDPPYGKGLVPAVLGEFSERDMIPANLRVVAETPKNDILPASFGSLRMVDTRAYGDTRISIYIGEDG